MIRLLDQIGLEALGIARPSPALLRSVASQALGRPVTRVRSASVLPVAHEIASVATAALHRVEGVAGSDADGWQPWSAFLKVLQHPRYWPMLGLLPAGAAADMLVSFPWREEIDTRAAALPVLPDGLRVPDLYALDELPADRAAMWLEDVDADDSTWSLADYAVCSRLLGTLAARRTTDRAAGASRLPPGYGVRKLVETRGPMVAGFLADDRLWESSIDAGLVDETFRADLDRALATTPLVLAELDRLPLALPHGDASPANLLRPRGEPDVFVAIDWAFGSPMPLGHDLGQLLVGGAESHGDDPARLPAIWERVLAGYAEGLAEEGTAVDEQTLVRGALSSLVTRTLPSAYPLEQAQGELSAAQRDFLSRRAAVARFVIELALG